MRTSAKLIAFTRPVDKSYGDTAEEFIAYCARVSNPDNQNNHNTGGKLISYLANNKHWSPFEMASAVVEVITTRDIARQILRHRSFSFQEFSQRYGTVHSFSEPRGVRLQDTKNRQNSVEMHDSNPNKALLTMTWEGKQKELLDKSREIYEWALNNEIAKEVARTVLPEGLTISRLYMSGTMRSWMHYLEQRATASSGTQAEHREVAQLCALELSTVMPMFKRYYEYEKPD